MVSGDRAAYGPRTPLHGAADHLAQDAAASVFPLVLDPGEE